MKFARLSLVLLAVFAFSGVSRAQSELVVYAASSLTDGFEQIAESFEAAHPGVDVLFNFAGSSDLAAQLSEGAPADVFASANARQMTVARDAGRIAGQPRTFVKNRLVLVVPADNPANISGLRDLAAEGVKIIIAGEGVPVRDYTNTMLDRLTVDSTFGEAFRAAFMANVVSEESNVRQVSAKIALGEADAGFVYASDVTPDISDDVQAIAIPDNLNTIATYPIAVTNDSANSELAQAFVDYVLSDAGQDTLVSWNFISVRIPEQPATVAIPAEDGVLTFDGQVLNPLSLNTDDLRAYTPSTVEVTYLSGTESVSTQFTGVPLWQIVSAAQPNVNADIDSDKLSMYLVVTATDGVQAVIAWGEIDPEFGNQPILLAYEENGAPLTDEQGAIRLVVPGDARGGRYVSGVANISLRDAPTLAR